MINWKDIVEFDNWWRELDKSELETLSKKNNQKRRIKKLIKKKKSKEVSEEKGIEERVYNDKVSSGRRKTR